MSPIRVHHVGDEDMLKLFNSPLLDVFMVNKWLCMLCAKGLAPETRLTRDLVCRLANHAACRPYVIHALWVILQTATVRVTWSRNTPLIYQQSPSRRIEDLVGGDHHWSTLCYQHATTSGTHRSAHILINAFRWLACHDLDQVRNTQSEIKSKRQDSSRGRGEDRWRSMRISTCSFFECRLIVELQSQVRFSRATVSVDLAWW